jgi:hypothetical protein
MRIINSIVDWISTSADEWIIHYRRHPRYFWGWLLGLIGGGLLGLWIPMALKIAKEEPIPFGMLTISGELSTFSIVVLIESVLTALGQPKSKRALPLAVIALFMIVFNAVFYTLILTGTNTLTIKWIVLSWGGASVFFAILLYQFKKIDPEESAAAVVEKENQEIENMASPKPDSVSSNPLP